MGFASSLEAGLELACTSEWEEEEWKLELWLPLGWEDEEWAGLEEEFKFTSSNCASCASSDVGCGGLKLADVRAERGVRGERREESRDWRAEVGVSECVMGERAEMSKERR